MYQSMYQDCRAAAVLMHGCEQRGGRGHLVNTGAVSVKLQSTELGLCPGVDLFPTASVCVGGMHGHERE